MDSIALRQLAADQAGLFTRAQARRCGYSAYQIRRRLGGGEWISVLGPVNAYAGSSVTLLLRDRAAQLAVPDCVLAAASAARRWGMPVDSLGPCLAVAAERHVRLPGVRILRTPVPDDDLAMVDGLQLTTRARTIVDCVRLLPERPAIDLLDRALQQRWIDFDELVWRGRDIVGLAGAPKVAKLIRMMGAGGRSEAERRLLSLLRRGGVGGGRANVPIEVDGVVLGVGDLVFEEARLVVEVDGWAYHVTPDRFQGDRERQNRLVAAGWTVLRFTWRDLATQPDRVVAEVATLITRRSPSVR